MTADDAYRPVRASKYQAMNYSFRHALQSGGRFAGTAAQQAALARQMRDLFDDDPGPDVVMLKHADTLGLADDLAKAQPNWSIGQYSGALASLLEVGQ